MARPACSIASWSSCTLSSGASPGGCLLQAGRLAEAEPVLLEALETLRARAGDEAQAETRLVRQRLVALYERWGKPEEARRHRSEPER